MFCTTCGTQNPDNGKYCTQCGQPLAPSQPTQAPPLPSMPPPPPTVGRVQASADAPNDGKAVASLICGILSVTLFSVFTGLPAIILGHMSRASIRRSMGKLKGDGLALAGLIMGYISFAFFIPIMLIVAAIAIPNLLRARMAANEASAVASLRTIHVSEQNYLSTFNQGFSPDLQSLGGNCSGSKPDTSHACMIDSVLSSGHKSGYQFTYQPGEADSDARVSKYFLIAAPLTPNTTGRNTFCTDESGVIHKAYSGEECTTESQELE